MQPKLFVGNLSYNVKESDLQELFQKYGEIKSVSLITDKYSGQSKGFAFVEMATSEDAEKALAENGKDFLGRTINVSEARPPKQFNDRGGKGGGFRGGDKSYGKRRDRY
ncbi:MAG: RNA-binding protein [Candidatus Omnitrophica bacterium]|nr:RNA-binding protein [Candidatus Omnitrophota bacterium]